MRWWWTNFVAALAVVAALLVAVPADAQDVTRRQWLDVERGQSHIEDVGRTYNRILISDPDVAEVKALTERQFQLRGLEVGVTDLWIWYADKPNDPVVYQIAIHQDLSDLLRRVADIVDDGLPPRVYAMKDRLVVDGSVADLETLERIAMVARVYDPEFVNLMSVRGDAQVQLQVTFAEVSRSALREMGLNALWGDGDLGFGVVGPNSGTAGVVARQQLSNYIYGGVAPSASSSGTFNMLGVVGDPIDLAFTMSVLEQNSITKVLAEPTLVALSGQQAEFLAGGEIPIPVAQNAGQITIDFKEYGVKLVFVPTVLAGEVIDVRVYIEVSEVDSSTGTRIVGIEIPGFKARKSESHLRVQDGHTFAMAGMLSESTRYAKAAVPVLGELPLIGALFRYVSHDREETELMIFVTPKLVRPMAPGEVPDLPGSMEDNNPNDFEFYLLGRDHRTGSQDYSPAGSAGLQR